MNREMLIALVASSSTQGQTSLIHARFCRVLFLHKNLDRTENVWYTINELLKGKITNFFFKWYMFQGKN